jgi:hypothetical protein
MAEGDLKKRTEFVITRCAKASYEYGVVTRCGDTSYVIHG